MKNKFNSLTDYIFQKKQNKNKIAIIFNEKKFSYNYLEKKINAVANFFLKNGIKQNSKIGIVLPNSLEIIYCYLAASKIGATVVPLNSNYNYKTIIFNFKRLKTDFIIGWFKFIQYLITNNNNLKYKKKKLISVGKKIQDCLFFDDAINNNIVFRNKNLLNTQYIISLTSGSTGNPKPIVFNQITKILRSKAAIDLFKLKKTDIIITSTPLDVSLGQRLLFMSLMLGSTSVILRTFTENNWINSVNKYDVTFTILIANQIERLINNHSNQFNKIKSLKKIVSSSAKFNDKTKKNKKILNQFQLYEMYGASEIGTVTSLHLNKELHKFDTVGRSCPNVDIKILSNKRFLKNNIIGEIVCRTPLKFIGYLNSSKLTKKSFFNEYFKTGDLGFLDNDNFLHFIGRKKNTIIVSGTNVYPEDIEKVLLDLKYIKECCVIAKKDDKFGEAIFAIIRSNKKRNEIITNIKKHCLDNLSDFQLPRYFGFIHQFPKSPLGKIKRKEVEILATNIRTYEL